jgi:hypothetical protein
MEEFSVKAVDRGENCHILQLNFQEIFHNERRNWNEWWVYEGVMKGTKTVSNKTARKRPGQVRNMKKK